jgi:hypothetical protein
MDDVAIPEGFQLEEPVVTAQPSGGSSLPTENYNDQIPQGFELEEEKYGSPSAMLKTAALGASEGAAGPLGTLAAKHVFGMKDQEQQRYREFNPVTHSLSQAVGLGASLLAGTGEGALLAKAGEGAAALAGLSKAAEGTSLAAKVGAEAVNQATQMALFQGSDEISKMIINDPNATVDNAISNIGLSAALGGVTGAGIGAISPLFKAGSSKAAKFLNEFKGEIEHIRTNPEPLVAATKELEELHANTQSLKESLYSSGLKGDLIKEQLPELTADAANKVKNQFEQVSNKLRASAEKALDSVDTKAAAPYIEQRVKDFEANILKANTMEDGYNALNTLKQDLAADAKAGGAYGAHPEVSVRGKLASELAAEIRPMLEDQDVWGNAGKIQKVFNQSFHEFTQSKAEKDFLKVFTNEVGGERVLNPAKVETFIKQLGSAKAEIKNEILTNYINEHSKFADKINKISTELGKEPLVSEPTITALNKLMGETTPGAKAAQAFVNKIGDAAVGKGLGASLGAAAGHSVGLASLGAIIGEHTLGPAFSKALNGLTKSIVDNPVSATGFKSALDLAINAAKGQSILNKATESVFKTGQAFVHDTVAKLNDESRSKLDKIVTKAQIEPDKITNVNTGDLNHYLPNHQAALSQSTAVAVKYLASIKPHPYRSSPLDKEIEPSKAEMARYNRALDIAQQPMIVLQHVKDGTLQATDIQDLGSMYPSLYNQMVEKLSQQISSAQGAEVNIPYKTRMSLSLFMHQPLDTSMLPASIQAAQPIPQQPQQQQKKPSNSAAKAMYKGNKQYMTPLQSSEAHKASR